MIQKMVVVAAMLSSALFGRGETVLSTASSAAVPANTTFEDGASIASTVTIDYGPFDWDDTCSVTVNGLELLSSTDWRGTYVWQPCKLGANTLIWSSANQSITSTVNVAALSFFTQPEPNPPMAKVSSLSITPLTRNFGTGGGGGAVIVSGSGTWTAAASEPWITLNATSGQAGYPVAYTVTQTTNVAQRVGYVYVSGYTHTVTQDGIGADVAPTSITKESAGGSATVTLSTSGKWAWDAAPGADWVNVSPTHGVGSGSVTVTVAPYNEVSTRATTVTVGGTSVDVFQYGRRMKLSTYRETRDYETHVIPVVVNALAATTWSVQPNNSWIAVVDGGNGRGGDTVSLSIGENPSYLARTGTVTIGTETFTIVQEGRTALSFSVSPTSATASVAGGNGVLAVLATPDLPWTAASGANWITVVAATASGAGNGNVVYNASPNPTLAQRTGKITITPAAGTGLAAKTLTVTQPAATAAISSTGYTFEASGEATTVDVTVNAIVEWSIVESLDWITVSGSTSRVGPGKVTLTARANDTVYPRSGTVKIAGKTFTVKQKARGVELEYDNIVFGTDGGYESFSVHPDGNVAWTAVASDATWITVFGATSGTGDAEVEYVISPYQGDGTPRTGWITVGDQKVYITQRAYDLDITPRAAQVTGNAGAGEIGVSAGIGDVWRAIVTEPWITIVTGFDAGTGSGTVRFTYTENDTGKTRTGKIIVSGEAYTLTQVARVLVNVSGTVSGHGGSVSGGGTYSLGDDVTLTAVPGSGYEFLYWTGDLGESMQNPLRFRADVPKSVAAHFGPLAPVFTAADSTLEGVRLSWTGLAWATSYRIYRAPTSEIPTKELATIAAPTCTYLDTTGTVGQRYFYWVEAVGPQDTTECPDAAAGMKLKPVVISDIAYTNLKGATHGNPATYTEGTSVTFTAPSAVTGYTFAGWTPERIETNTTGAVTVTANWTANTYKVRFNANGGTGTMADESFTYDAASKALTANAFTRTGHTFKGWAKSASGAVAYTDRQKVANLTSNQNGLVTLYAVWEINRHMVTVGSIWGEPSGTTYDYGSTVSVVAPADVVDAAGTTKYVCLGSSRFPDKGTNITFTVTDDVSFSWDVWQTNYWVSVETTGTGAVLEDGRVFQDGWRTNGCPVVLTAESAEGFRFTGWTGGLDGCTAEGATLSFAADRPRALGASFAVREPERVALPAISPADGATFGTPSCEVTLACTTAGAEIYYTTNGRTPRQSETYRYKGPFTITDTTTVLAFAVKDGQQSDLLEATITKIEPELLTLKGALDEVKLGRTTTGGDAEWIPDRDISAQVGDSLAVSGALGVEQATWLETTVEGKGTLTFWWKVSCEPDPRKRYTYDHVACSADGSELFKLDGESGWEQKSVTFDTDGAHVVRWTYSTDDWEEPGWQDRAWVDGVTWSGAAAPEDATLTTDVPVPYAWLEKFYPGTSDYEAKAKAPAANGVNTVEEAYVAGLDPTDPVSELKATIELRDGKIHVDWTPNLNTGAVTRIYRVYGRSSLDSGEWESPARSAHRFFKVSVSMPTGAPDEKTAVAGEGIALEEGAELGGVQLWEGGPYWAECNVGASKPEEAGYYFWWGDTVGYVRKGGTWTGDSYSDVTWVSSTGTRMGNSPFKWGACPTDEKSMSELKALGYIDATGSIVAKYDAATIHLGAPWRMPTELELDDLVHKCDWIWTSRNGVNGWLVTGKGAFSMKSIFLPAAGYGRSSDLKSPGSYGGYWSSTPDPDYFNYAWSLVFNSRNFGWSNDFRIDGSPVRPLRGFAK